VNLPRPHNTALLYRLPFIKIKCSPGSSNVHFVHLPVDDRVFIYSCGERVLALLEERAP